LIWCKILCWAQKSILYGVWNATHESPKTEFVSHEIFISRVTYPSIRNFMLSSKKYTLKVQSKATRAQKRNLLVINFFEWNKTYPSNRNFKLNSKKYTLWGLKCNHKTWEPKNLNKFKFLKLIKTTDMFSNIKALLSIIWVYSCS
jgi:hypothetical protein